MPDAPALIANVVVGRFRPRFAGCALASPPPPPLIAALHGES